MQENVNIPDSTITTNLSFRQLVLMNMQQLTNFPYIEKDFDALTDYELLSLVVKYLNDVIANQNEQNDSITRMYQSFLDLQTYVNNTKDTLEDAFNELDDYVRNYFDNLDVQDEINNKLDQMLEDGVLEQIIEQFLQSTAVWCFNTVADMKAATNLVDGSDARTLGYYSINDGGGSLYHITNTQSLTEYQEVLNSGLYATLMINNKITPQSLGAYGDGTHIDNNALNTYFEICYQYNLDANGYNKNYLVDNSTESYCNHTGLKVPGAIEIHNFNFILNSGSTHFNTILACKYNNNDYYIHDCNFTGELRNPTGAGAEDGGNHGIIFCDGLNMFPSDWSNYGKITIENCKFNYIQSYCIFPTPNNNDLIIKDCEFSSHGPAILAYATNSLIEKCSYTYLDSTGTTIHTLCIDEIENFSNPTDILKNTTIKNCKTSNRLYDINNAVQLGLNYGTILIENCESQRELFISNASNFSLNVQKLIIKDSENKTASGDSGFYITHITGDIILDNVKIVKNSRIIVTGNITIENMTTDRQIYLGTSAITNFKILNCVFNGTQSEGFISSAGATTPPTITKFIYNDCDFNTRSIIMRSLNISNLIMQNVRSIGYTPRYVYNPTQQATNAYIDGLVTDTANTGSDFILDGVSSAIVNGVGKSLLLHNVTSSKINMVDITT